MCAIYIVAAFAPEKSGITRDLIGANPGYILLLYNISFSSQAFNSGRANTNIISFRTNTVYIIIK